MSFAIATSILRSVAACCASLESNWRRSSLVTPSTMVATSAPKLALDVVRGDGGVLDRVVQERGGDGDVVEAEVGEDQRHPERVGDVGLPRAADLLAVGVAGDVEGVLDQVGVGPAVPLAVGVDERRELDVDGVWRRQGSTERRSVRTSTRGPLPDRSVVLICATTLQAGRVFPGPVGRPTGQRRLRRRCWRPRGLAAPRDAVAVAGRGAADGVTGAAGAAVLPRGDRDVLAVVVLDVVDVVVERFDVLAVDGHVHRGAGARRAPPGRRPAPWPDRRPRAPQRAVPRLALLEPREDRRGHEDRRVGTGEQTDEQRQREVAQRQRRRARRCRRTAATPPAAAPRSRC